MSLPELTTDVAMRVESVPLGAILVEASFQGRVETSVERATAYAHYQRSGVPMPPIQVFGVNWRKPYWLGDGFTRLLAHEMLVAEGVAGAGHIECEIREGGAREAMLWATRANAANAYPRTHRDLRRIVTAMLADPVWGNPGKCPSCGHEVAGCLGACPKCGVRLWSDRHIAEHCSVSSSFVSDLRRQWRAGMLDENGQPRREETEEAEATLALWDKVRVRLERTWSAIERDADGEERRLWAAARETAEYRAALAALARRTGGEA